MTSDRDRYIRIFDEMYIYYRDLSVLLGSVLCGVMIFPIMKVVSLPVSVALRQQLISYIVEVERMKRTKPLRSSHQQLWSTQLSALSGEHDSIRPI